MYEPIRQAVTQHMLAARDVNEPGLVVVFGDDPFDWNSPPPHFLHVEIEFVGAAQLALSPTPRSRVYGLVTCGVRSKRGQGERAQLLTLTWCNRALQYATFSLPECVVECGPFRPSGSDTRAAVSLTGGLVSFRADPRA